MKIEELESKGFLQIDYPQDIYQAVRASLKSWQSFCALPQETKSIFSKNDRHSDFGYMRRADTGKASDNKELFHATKRDLEELKLGVEGAGGGGNALNFYTDLEELITKVSPLVSNIVSNMEKHFSLPNFADNVMSKRDSWTFRYLHYFGGEILANPHCDRGAFTLHLCETATGGEYLNMDGYWEPWPVSERETILFGAMELQHLSDCRLKALWHKVASDSHSKENGRYAIVLFLDFDYPFIYNSDVYGRLQEMSEGFNYNMPPDEFKKFFIKRN